MTFRETLENAGKADVVGVATRVIGSLVATRSATRTPRDSTVDRHCLYRQRLGKAILLGLELLVAADVIRTVAVRPTLETAAVVAITQHVS
jgi:uncharacterized membrane protein